MRRQHPFLSTSGILVTAVLLAVLGILLWRSGGKAFSPGRLSVKSKPGVSLQGFASHAAFEGDCSLCHQPLQKAQHMLCLDCHEDVQGDIDQKKGTHALIDSIERCFSCHSDHQGEGFDPTLAAYAHFDHSNTHFSLIRHQVNYDTTPIACSSCHTTQGEFTASVTACAVCHASHDLAFTIQHAVDFGEGCIPCHDGHDRMAEFDHQATAFPLEDAHAGVACAACHTQRGSSSGQEEASPVPVFEGTSRECASCHKDDDPHPGMFSGDCTDCHTPRGWTPAKFEGANFEHQSQTGFSLVRHLTDYDGSPLTCNDCHGGTIQSFDQVLCVTCHSEGAERAGFMSDHVAEFGKDCTGCHDGVDRMHDFNHDTVFLLDGKHAEIDCQACHANQVFTGTPRECVDCHAEPEIHAGFFGLHCQVCHTTQAWTPALLRMHRFPLDHGEEGEVACKTCHPSRYNEYTCFGCHEHDPVKTEEEHREEEIAPAELMQCATCHPTGQKEEN